ncbi:formate dehydrogenase accessory sulfurtransferase FdhD [Spongiimicrobium salis]|uniref:formate dehydrogenase accessory sulfurtransferase FdhD n=1 Tax=Spongiimicrobium salis TaxID=1667022 RepID=UPI00374D9702
MISKNPATQHLRIIKVKNELSEPFDDGLAIEAPLEIGLSIPENTPPILRKNISITMRTPGQDEDLALGFLFTEGIIARASQVNRVRYAENKATVSLNTSEPVDLSKIERHFYTSSSCGVCGKSSIEAIKTVCRLEQSKQDFQVAHSIIGQLPERLRRQQHIFEHTGGLHAAALFTTEGNFIALREDVGRHNALDKLIGAMFTKENLPLEEHLLVLSGRASFELIQKAAMAGIRCIMAVGAPSSLAVELAQDFDITLIGFLKANSYNIYHGEKRIAF